jgi:hypothetical protein
MEYIQKIPFISAFVFGVLAVPLTILALSDFTSSDAKNQAVGLQNFTGLDYYSLSLVYLGVVPAPCGYGCNAPLIINLRR